MMTTIKKTTPKYRSVLYVGVLLFYLVWTITGANIFEPVFAFLLIALVLQALPGASRSYLLMTCVLFGLGTACLLYSGATSGEWLSAIANNGGLVALFLSLPLFSIILSYEDYLPAVSGMLRARVKSAAGLNILTVWVGYLLGAIINIAAVPILYTLLQKDAKFYGAEENFYRSLARANIAAVFWAPNYISVATVLTFTKLSWLAIAPLGFLLSCFLTLLISISLLFPLQKSRPFPTTPDIHDKQPGSKDLDWGPILRLFTVYLGLIATVGLLNYFTSIKILAIVALTAILFPLAAAVAQRKLPIYRQEIGNYYHHKLPAIKNEVIFFAAVGFFGKAMEISGLGSAIFGYIHLTAIPSPNLTVFMIISLLAVLAFVGIHPIVSISALSASLGAASFGLSSLAYAYTLLLGYCLGVLNSPFSAITLVMSGTTGKSPWYVAPKINWLFALTTAVIFSLLLPLI